MASRIIFTCTTVPTRQEYTDWVSANTDTTRNKTYTITDGYQVDLYVNDNVTTIEGPIFANSTIKTILFNTPNVTQLSTYTPGSTTWSNGLFYNCKSLKNVQFPKNLQIIGGSCFWGCSSLISAILPDSVTTIDGSSFNCSNLYYIKIPASVTYITEGAFTNLPNDVQIVCEGTTPAATGSDPFGSNYSLNIYVPSSALTNYQQSTYFWGLYNLAATPSNHRFICEFKIGTYYYDYTSFLNSNTITASNKRITLSDSYIDVIYMKDSLTNLPERAFNGVGAESIEFDSKIITNISGTYSAYGGSFAKSEAKYIKLPESVTSIGAGAFTNCNLKFLYIPSTLSTIYVNIFYSKITYDTVRSYSINSIVVDEDNVTFSDGDGSDCIIKLSNSRLAIGCGNTIIPLSVTEFEDNAFNHCANLINITVPARMTKYSFVGCENLQTVVLENGLTNIENNAFYDCTSLPGITIPSSITSIGDSAFCGCTSLQSITIPSSVTSIGTQAFRSCTSLQSITIPSTVTSLGYGIFQQCTSIQTVVLENGITAVSSSIFSGCTSLQSITIPSSVTSIGAYAFSGCTSLQSITIPSSVTSIGGSAFTNTGWWNSHEDGLVVESVWCLGLKGTTVTNVTIPQNVEKLSDNCFTDNTVLVSITINDNLTKIPNTCFARCSNLENVIFSQNSSITYLGAGAFQNCSKLTSISLPNNLLYIGSNCFANSKLEGDLIIPNSVEEIYSSAFFNTNISSVTTSKNWKKTSLNQSTGGPFSGCENLTTVNWNTINNIENTAGFISGGYFNSSPVSEFNIATDVEILPEYLFYGTNNALQSIILPESLISIRAYAFTSCPNLLSVTSLATTPPTLGSYNFTTSDDTLYMPIASKSAYQSASNWSTAFTYYKGLCEISTSTDGNGTITPTELVAEGESFTVTATPNAHYKVSHFVVDGIDVGTVDNYTFQNLDADHTVYVEFELITHTITATAYEGGAIVPSGTITVIDGENQSFDIIPLEGYGILALFIDGTQIDPTPTYTFENVLADHTIDAMFYSLQTAGFNRDEMLDIDYLLQDYLEQRKNK